MVVQSSSTCALYMYFVIPRYLVIRSAAQYDARNFDGWEVVLAVRCVLMASIALAACQCMRMTLAPLDAKPRTKRE